MGAPSGSGKESVDARRPPWPDSVLEASGVVFVATGRRFVDEASVAAALLRRTNPGLRICLVSDAADPVPVFWDDLIVVRGAQGGFRDKILMGLCPYRRFLYLDTDAHVFHSLEDFWPMLGRFDFVGHQLFEGHDCPLPGIPDAFPEFQGGVLGFRRSRRTNPFFDAWLRVYDEFFGTQTGGRPHYSNVSDQKSLRRAIWESDLAVGVLGPEYNFTPCHLVFACATVRILHGRTSARGMEQFESRINAALGNRVYVPRFDAIVSDHMGRRQLAALWFSATLQLVRELGRAVTPRGWRDALRGGKRIRRWFLGGRFQEHERQQEDKFAVPAGAPPRDPTNHTT